MKLFNQLSKKKKIIFSVILFAFLIKYNYFSRHILKAMSVNTLIIKNIIIILVLLISANFIFKNKKRSIYTFILYFLYTLIFFANLWYNRYFGNYLSLADLTMGQGIRPFKVLSRQLINYCDILFGIEFPFLIYLIFFTGSFKKSKLNICRDKKYRKEIMIVLFLITILIASHILYVEAYYSVPGFVELYEDSTPAFISVYGISPLYPAEFIAMSRKEREVIKPTTEKEIVGEEDLSTDYNCDDIKNIIVIQLESFDEKVIDYQYNDQELTPFLNSLKKSSIYFDNIYAQHINGSFDAEFSVLTSLYPINKNYAFKTNDMTEFNSLVKVLKKRNFDILAFHNNKEEFFYRNKGFPEMGFDKFYHRDYFTTENAEVGEDSYLGINDFDFFNQSIKYLKRASDPFLAFYITVTSHTPFDFYPEEYSLDVFKDIQTPIVRDYFNSVHFTDQSLKNFFKKLKQENLFDNTIFVIYSDHGSDINKKTYSLSKEFNITANTELPEKIPLMIYHPDLNYKRISKAGSHTDIAPTLLDLLGDKEKPDGFLGVSLLKEKENPVLFLHEMPQILYKDNLFIRMPESATKSEEVEFKQVGSRDENKKNINLADSEKTRMIKVIKYMKEVMKKNIIEE